MSAQKKTTAKQKRRVFRVRNKFVSKGLKPRISVFRSSNHIYVQAIDDSAGSTILGFSSTAIEGKDVDKKAVAKQVGLEFGKKIKDKSISEVFFDRGRYKFHGRVAALAEGLREAGVKF